MVRVLSAGSSSRSPLLQIAARDRSDPARSLLAELPVVLGQHRHAAGEAFAVGLVRQVGAVRAAAVRLAALDDALAGGGAEDTGPV